METCLGGPLSRKVDTAFLRLIFYVPEMSPFPSPNPHSVTQPHLFHIHEKLTS